MEKGGETMKIEIDPDYLLWLQEEMGLTSETAVAEYVNDVLRSHRRSWDSEDSDQ